jgi:hypothetical protein
VLPQALESHAASWKEINTSLPGVVIILSNTDDRTSSNKPTHTPSKDLLSRPIEKPWPKIIADL